MPKPFDSINDVKYIYEMILFAADQAKDRV